MIVVVQLLLVVALATLVKLGTRRLFGGNRHDRDQTGGEPNGERSVDSGRRGKPKPTSRTNGPRRH